MEEQIIDMLQPFEGYKISNYGYLINPHGDRIDGSNENNGYRRVHLPGAHAHRALVHRLVLTHFQPVANPEDLQCNHKDKNRSNNRLDNLEWVTARQNSIHASGKKVQMFRVDDDEPIAIWDSISLASEVTGYSPVKICNDIHGRSRGREHIFRLAPLPPNFVAPEDLDD